MFVGTYLGGRDISRGKSNYYMGVKHYYGSDIVTSTYTDLTMFRAGKSGHYSCASMPCVPFSEYGPAESGRTPPECLVANDACGCISCLVTRRHLPLSVGAPYYTLSRWVALSEPPDYITCHEKCAPDTQGNL